MQRHVLAIVFTYAVILCAAATKPPNAIQVASSEWLGNVTSSNTNWGRDLGFQGQIGDCYINTFGDDFKCQSENPQEDCFFGVTARNSCAQPLSPTSYKDYFVGPKGAPIACVTPTGKENKTTPMGITNIVETAPNTGMVYVLPGAVSKSKRNPGFAGAGYAIVTVDDSCNITMNRPEKSLWYGDIANTSVGSQPFNESFYGDHGVLKAQDGYIYVYGGIPNHNGLALARTKPEDATELSGYEYYNGTAWQTERIKNPTLKNSVINETGQGSIFWSPYYSRYIFLSTYYTKVTAQTAEDPWGPWSRSKDVWKLKQMPYRFRPAKGNAETLYSPAVQPKFSAEDGSDFTFWVTYAVGKTRVADKGGHQVTTAVRVSLKGGTPGGTGGGGSSSTTSSGGDGSGDGDGNSAGALSAGTSGLVAAFVVLLAAFWV